MSFSCCLCGYFGLVDNICLDAIWFSSAIACVGMFKFERTCVLCDEMIDFMFGIHV